MNKVKQGNIMKWNIHKFWVLIQLLRLAYKLHFFLNLTLHINLLKINKLKKLMFKNVEIQLATY